MRKITFIFLVFSLLFLANFTLAEIDNNAKYYQINLQKIDGKIISKGVIVQRGIKKIEKKQKTGIATLYSFKEKKLITTNFDLPINKKNINLEIPYYNLGKEITITRITGEELLRVDVSAYADTCGDGKCQNYESYYSCDQDCLSGGSDRFCDQKKDGICDPDCLPKKLDPDYPDCSGSLKNKNTANFVNKINIIERNKKKITEKENKKIIKQNSQKTNYFSKIIISFLVLVLIIIIIFFIIKTIKKEE